MSIQHTPLCASQEQLITRVPIALMLTSISAFDPWFCHLSLLEEGFKLWNLDAIPEVPCSMALHYLYLPKMIPSKAKHFTLQLLLTAWSSCSAINQSVQRPISSKIVICFLYPFHNNFQHPAYLCIWCCQLDGSMKRTSHGDSRTLSFGFHHHWHWHWTGTQTTPVWQVDDLLSLVAQLRTGSRMVKEHQGVWEGDRLVEPACLRQEPPEKKYDQGSPASSPQQAENSSSKESKWIKSKVLTWAVDEIPPCPPHSFRCLCTVCLRLWRWNASQHVMRMKVQLHQRCWQSQKGLNRTWQPPLWGRKDGL